jgi:predicted transcriptional regulator containing an HTH domain and an uncharacterized domain shared with the mammalian protein schlafen
MKVLGFVNRYSRGVQVVQDELRTNGNVETDFKLHLDTTFLVVKKIANKEANKEPREEDEKPIKEARKPIKEPRKELEDILLKFRIYSENTKNLCILRSTDA